MTSTGLSYSGSDGAWGWNAGALFTLSPAMRVGVSYRSAVNFSPDGGSGIKLPDTAILSVWQQVSDRWEAMGDFPIPTGTRSSRSAHRAKALTSTMRGVSPGRCLPRHDAWKLVRIAYDRSPTRTTSSRIARMPDNDNLWLSLGAQWNTGRYGRIDAGYSYIYVGQRHRQHRQRHPGAGQLRHQLARAGAQYSIGF